VDETRRKHPAPTGGARGSGVRLRPRVTTAGAALGVALAACSSLSNNSDGIATLDVRLPVNFYLEQGRPLTLTAVAKNADGDSVAATIAWRTPDTTLAVDSATGSITALYPTGKGRVQVAVVGSDAFASGIDNLSFTLTGPADTLILTGPDSVEAAMDSVGVQITGLVLQGGTPPIPTVGRPVSFSIVDPAPVDSPSVVLTSSFGRTVRDSTFTDANGVAGTLTVIAFRGKRAPDRVVVQADALRASGELIPGSGRLFVVRFLHQ
jgi:hypothetical protein